MNIRNDQTNSAVKSPCVRNCCLDKNDICMGCFRSLDEITQWAVVDEDTRLQYVNNSNGRKNQAIKSRF